TWRRPQDRTACTAPRSRRRLAEVERLTHADVLAALQAQQHRRAAAQMAVGGERQRRRRAEVEVANLLERVEERPPVGSGLGEDFGDELHGGPRREGVA